MKQTPNFVKTSQKMLTRELEETLFEDWQAAIEEGNKREENRLFQQIIFQFSPIVKKMVKKMNGYKMDPEELTSEALAGLVKAAVDFKPEMGFRFGTYASRCVMLTLFSFITQNYFMSNLCSNSKNKKLFFRIRRVMAEQIQEGEGGRLSIEMAEQLAESTGATVDDVLNMHMALREPYSSLNQSMGDTDDGMTKEDYVIQEGPMQEELVGEEQLQILQKQLIEEAFGSLDDRAAYIVRKQRYFSDDEESMTLEQLGSHFQISKERVRQIRQDGIENMEIFIRHQIREMKLKPNEIY